MVAELARVLGVGDGPGEAFEDRLAVAAADREVLLVVDNFEHVLEAAPSLAQMLSIGAQLRVLTTSRERLHLVGERGVPGPAAADAGPGRTDRAWSRTVTASSSAAWAVMAKVGPGTGTRSAR